MGECTQQYQDLKEERILVNKREAVEDIKRIKDQSKKDEDNSNADFGKTAPHLSNGN